MPYTIEVITHRTGLDGADLRQTHTEPTQESAMRTAKALAHHYRQAGCTAAVYAPDGECIWKS